MGRKISVIIPLYNVEKYIKRCIDSVIGQTYSDFELILVDDGSVDGSGDICDLYKEKDSRIKVIHKENEGVSVARNTGLKNATGEYICFIDADDYVSSVYLEKLCGALESGDYDMAMCDFDNFTGDVYHGEKEPASEYKDEYLTIEELLKKIHITQGELYVVVWGKIFKRNIVENIEFPAGRICEDLAVLYRYYDKVKKAVRINSVLYYYFRGNVSSYTYDISTNTRFYEDVDLALAEENRFFMEKGENEFAALAHKTRIYWLFDLYRKMYIRGRKTEGKEKKENRAEMKKILKKYRTIYKDIKDINIEKFYRIFYFMPGVYMRIRTKKI